MGRRVATHEEVKKLRTGIVERREDFTASIARECRKLGIGVVCSAFEADWDLVQAQKSGMIDIVTSDDGDLFMLGADNVVSNCVKREY